MYQYNQLTKLFIFCQKIYIFVRPSVRRVCTSVRYIIVWNSRASLLCGADDSCLSVTLLFLGNYGVCMTRLVV